MKESKENIVAYHKRKRKMHKIKLLLVSVLLLIIGVILIGGCYYFNKKDNISYKETSDVKYGVALLENEFYEEKYLKEGIDVISNLIKNIDAEFKYNLELEEEIEYKYNYKILAEIIVKEKSKTNLIYKTEEEIVNKKEQEAKSNKLEILEQISINYKKYNDFINKLIDIYNLQNTTSELQLNLYLDVINKSTEEKINKENKAMTLIIPLTTNTVEITINENIKDEEGNILKQADNFINLKYVFAIGISTIVMGVLTLIRLIKYISDTRSAEKMYDDELKKILFDYKGYIQKVKNKIDYKEYKVIKIESFKELLAMREKLQSPILMHTTEKDRKTTFIMIKENLLFEFILEAKLIREDLIKRSKEKAEKNEKNK